MQIIHETGCRGTNQHQSKSQVKSPPDRRELSKLESFQEAAVGGNGNKAVKLHIDLKEIERQRSDHKVA